MTFTLFCTYEPLLYIHIQDTFYDDAMIPRVISPRIQINETYHIQTHGETGQKQDGEPTTI